MSLLSAVKHFWEIIGSDADILDNEKAKRRLIFVANTAVLLIIIIIMILNILSGASRELFLANVILLAAYLIVNIMVLIRVSLDILNIILSSFVSLIFSYLIYTGGNDGFAINWTILIPYVTGLIYGMKWGFFLGMYFTIFISVSFYTPLHTYYQYEYPQLVLQRFPILYGACFLTVTFSIFQLKLLYIRQSAHKKSAEEAQARAEAASESKTKFLTTMSHEIRTPMNAILGMAELALRTDDLNVARDHIITVKQSGVNLLSIINDILDLSKIETGKLDIIPVDYFFSSLVSDVSSIIRMRVHDSLVRFVVNVDSSIPNALFGDEIRIRQALINLLNNAVKYTDKGFVSFAVHGEKTGEDTINLIMEVSDSGRGIKQADLQKLFSEYIQVDLEKNKNIEGTGLGLAITQNLVKAMGGKISVYSEYGKGSTFTVTLPQKIRSHEPLAHTENPYECNRMKAGFTAPDASILVVDDIITNLKVAQGLLMPYMMNVDICKDGMLAIEAVKTNHYDIVFMDHLMPEMDGIETTRQIRAWEEEQGNTAMSFAAGETQRYLRKQIPIIALTASAVSGMREMFLEEGFNDFLSKPIDTILLNAILEKWIPKEKQKK